MEAGIFFKKITHGVKYPGRVSTGRQEKISQTNRADGMIMVDHLHLGMNLEVGPHHQDMNSPVVLPRADTIATGHKEIRPMTGVDLRDTDPHEMIYLILDRV
jgi:hypothetical protein